MILDKLKQKALEYAKQEGLKLIDFDLCEQFTYAKVAKDDKSFIGVTLTPRNEGELNKIDNFSIDEILSIKSYDIALRALGLALINAIGQYAIAKDGIELQGNIQENLAKKLLEESDKTDKIVFIGHLTPVVAKLRAEGRDVDVFCRTQSDFKNGVYNDIFEYEALTYADIVVVTGASLIGSTIDAVLKFSTDARMVILAGFSAGADPKWYEGLGFTHVTSTYLEEFSVDIIKQNNLGDVFNNPSYFKELKR